MVIKSFYYLLFTDIREKVWRARDMKGKTPSAEEAPRKTVEESTASGLNLPDAGRAEKAFSELVTRGAEEIQDHLSLVARTQVRIRTLLQTSIEELERAQRLETLTRLIAGNTSADDEPQPGQAFSPADVGDRPDAYLEREIRTLRKMQKLVGPPVSSAGEPAATAEEATDGPLPASGSGEEEATGVPGKILIVYHDPGTVRVLRYFLEKENYEVAACSNGQDGIQRAVRDRPDIILLDVLLPGMDGFQVLGRLKKNEKTSAIPVFVLSVMAQEADILKAIECGAADYFTKPFSPPIIIAKIRRARKARHE
jgi:CheY-like chemotaxis protein